MTKPVPTFKCIFCPRHGDIAYNGHAICGVCFGRLQSAHSRRLGRPKCPENSRRVACGVDRIAPNTASSPALIEPCGVGS